MVQHIQAPNGDVLEFPDDMKDEDIASVMKKNYPTPVERDSNIVSLLKQNPKTVQPESKLAEFKAGMSRPIANIDRFTGALLKKVGIDDGYQHRYSDYNTRLNDAQASGKIQPGTLTEGAGELTASAPFAALSKSRMLGNAIASALTSNASTPSGVLTDTAVGTATGKATDIGIRGAGAVIAPKINPFVQKLLDKGVNLTPGQIIGGTTHRLEDASTSLNIPFVAQAQKRSIESFNKSVVQEGLNRIGSKLPSDIRAGHDSIDFAQGEFDKAYDKVIPQLTLKKDAQWAADNGNLKTLANQGLDGVHLKRFNEYASQVDKKFSGNDTMSGESMKDLEETLRKEYQNYGKGGPTDRNYADSIRELQAQVRDLAERTNPTQAKALQNINSGYAMLTRAEGAARDAPEGVFTPAQFRKSVVNMDPSTRKRAAAAGNALLQDLAVAGEKVLPRTVNDSGTATRLLAQGGVGAALFGTTAALTHVNPLGVGALASILSAYTKTGQKVTSKVLTARPPGAGTVRRVLQEAAPVAARASSAAETEHRNTNLQENR